MYEYMLGCYGACLCCLFVSIRFRGRDQQTLTAELFLTGGPWGDISVSLRAFLVKKSQSRVVSKTSTQSSLTLRQRDSPLGMLFPAPVVLLPSSQGQDVLLLASPFGKCPSQVTPSFAQR